MRASLVAGALLAAGITGTAHATPSPCVSAPVATYTTGGFSCTLDGGDVIADRFGASAHAAKGGSAALFDIIPIDTKGAVGFRVTEALSTGPAGIPNGTADATMTFQLIGSNGALFTGDTGAVTGLITGAGHGGLDFQAGGVKGHAEFGAPETITFASPFSILTVHKDQLDGAGSDGVVTSSEFSDTISLKGQQVSEPASLGLLLAGVIGLCAVLVPATRPHAR